MLFNDAVLTPRDGPRVGVIAVAKTDLAPGTVIQEFGGFEAYGVAENIDAIRSERLLPMGLALGCTVTGPVSKDTALTFDDVTRPPERLVDRLYAEQEVAFGGVRPVSVQEGTFA